MTLALHPVAELDGVVASADMIVAWAKAARAGDLFVYATRCSLPVASAGAKAARDLAGQGLVLLTQARVTGTDLRNYRATRSGRAWPSEKAPPRRVDHVDEEAICIDRLLPHLQRAARFGLPCPTDSQLARKAGVEVMAVAPTLRAMNEYGIIRIEGVRAPTLRRVTIVATGHRTGMVA